MKDLPPHSDAPHIKVCGLTRAEDALLALELGASFLGLIFARESPRRLTVDAAAALLEEIRARATVPVRAVGVFVEEPEEGFAAVAERLGLAAVQLHGKSDPGALPVPAIRAVNVRGAESAEEIRAAQCLGPVLLDAFVEGRHGGTGKVFDHALAVEPIGRGPVFIAGGLGPDNIALVAGRLREAGAVPYAYDLSSGLEERPGVKSPEKMRAFFAALHEGSSR